MKKIEIKVILIAINAMVYYLKLKKKSIKLIN